jgi:Flp pilus assembly protein TadD
MARKRMKTVRYAWYIAGAMALLAGLVVAVRQTVAPGGGSPAPTAATVEEATARMLRLLDDDPRARDEETRRVVARLASWARAEKVVNRETLYALGLRRKGAGDLEGAVEAYREAIERDPEWARPWTGLGIALHALGQTREAEEALRRAVELDPNWSRPHNDLAILLRIAGEIDEAQKHAERALELAGPGDVAPLNTYGNILVKLGRLEEAAALFERAAKLEPREPALLYNLACVRALQGRKDRALRLLARAVAMDPAFRAEAKKDDDLDALRGDPAFEALVYSESGAA